jgi:hypothetical protein
MNRASATTSPYPSDSALADHAHRFDALESSPSTSKAAVAFSQPGPLFDGSMILFDNIIKILASPSSTQMQLLQSGDLDLGLGYSEELPKQFQAR